MRILITTGVYPPRIGGPAQYAKNLKEEFEKQGHKVVVLTYGIEHYLPPGVRHLLFFIRVLIHMPVVDFALAFDTYSVGFPTALASWLLSKKVYIRTGGDFLWEGYVARTGHKILLKDFYKAHNPFSFKERVIFKITRWTLHRTTAIVFSTEYQRSIFNEPYKLGQHPTEIIENHFGPKGPSKEPREKNYLWYFRDTAFKNDDLVRRAFKRARVARPEIVFDTGRVPYEEMIEKMRNCYAVVLPSLTELSPNHIFNAIRFNKPFIVTRHSGYTEMFEKVGLLVDPLSVSDIEEKIRMLADDAIYKEYKDKLSAFHKERSYTEVAQDFLSLNAKYA